MNDVRKLRISVPALASALVAATGFWYMALALHLSDIREFVGLRFCWTACLGLEPFIGLVLTAMLAEAYAYSDRSKLRLVCVATAIGLSPWGLWVARICTGVW